MLRRKQKIFGGGDASGLPVAEPEEVAAELEVPVEEPKPALIRVLQSPEPRNIQDQVSSCYKDLTGIFDTFRIMTDSLAKCDRLNIKPLCKLKTERSNDLVNVGLRVDIDADVQTACRMARYCAQVGVGSSFYLLPTALYYGQYEKDLLVRSPELAAIVQNLIVAGCEIGLHNDVMHVASTTDLDPIGALWTELFWLRSHGANVLGTVGHNSISVYGADNSEVFKNRVFWNREVCDAEGQQLPVGLVDEKSFGLFYEGTYAKVVEEVDRAAATEFATHSAGASIRNEDWMRTYLTNNPCHDWDVDLQVWAIGQDRWVIGGGNTFVWDVSLAEMLDVVMSAELGAEVLVVLHPEYFRG